jgi:hypothetical protein
MRMNLFRSEEHVKRWSLYAPESEDAIMPVEDWAKLFAGPMFRNRLDQDPVPGPPEERTVLERPGLTESLAVEAQTLATSTVWARGLCPGAP